MGHRCRVWRSRLSVKEKQETKPFVTERIRSRLLRCGKRVATASGPMLRMSKNGAGPTIFSRSGESATSCQLDFRDEARAPAVFQAHVCSEDAVFVAWEAVWDDGPAESAR